MQELMEKAKQLLSSGEVARVLGWRKGENVWDAEPAFFDTADSLDGFVYNGFCGANLSKYMIEAEKKEGKTLDTYYAARRERGVLVSLACSRPETSCFCGTFGIDCAAPEGDVAAWLAGEYLYWQPRTEKGTALTGQVESLLEPWDDAPVAAEQATIRDICRKLPLKDLSLANWGADAAQRNFDSPLWEQLYKPCLACGTCTFVCPTCQCYDIKDYDTGRGVQRYRCWDSCMYSDFTMMAHGNNRTSQMQRFRQRFMHKLAYFPANNDGMFSCVGCGRCVDKCPSRLNIAKVIKAFGQEGNV